MTTETIKVNIKKLQELSIDMQNEDFLLTWEKSDDEILAVCHVAQCLKEMHKQRLSYRLFDTGLAISIFRDNSTRTRFSFASAANALGLAVSDLDEQKSQIAHGETVRETANMISFMTETIGIRDDMYLGEGNTYMRDVGEAVQEGYERGVLHHRPTLVNLQCDIDHPTQTLADLMKLRNYFGSFEKMQGKKIAITWAYSPSYGKPLSVPQGIIGLMTRLGMDVVLAHPDGYDLIPEVEEVARNNAARSGGSFRKATNMADAFDGAHVVYPKSWAPYQIMQQRTPLLKAGDRAGLSDLEQRCLQNNARFIDWECDADKMRRTRDGKALYMHCLPADISGVSCEQGEVSAEVFEAYRLETYHEASYKPFVIAAMIMLSKVKDPAGSLVQLLERGQKNQIV